jgi:Ca2+-binding EF-hand superfamily protein
MDFARFLAAFSDRASYEEKVKFIFWVYDVDGDGECAVSEGGCAVR